MVALLGGLMVFFWFADISLFPRKGLVSPAGVLVLEDSDSDFRIPPFEDRVILFESNGKAVDKVTGLNICETVGGCRSLSVAPDGSFFTVCESVGHQLSAYKLNTGERLWTLKGEFTSATVSPDGLVYALTSGDAIPGGIYGKQTLVIDPKGLVVRQALVGGFDPAVDAERKVLWLAGKNIKKCDLELKLLSEISSIGWCAVSLDLDRDGSVWVAERQHPDVAQSTNRIFKVSPAGSVLNSVGLPFSPTCLRVDRSDDSVWVTGGEAEKSATSRVLDSIEKRTGRLPIGKSLREFAMRPRVWSGTHRYDSHGALQRKIDRGGFSLDIEQTDGSVWIGGREKVYHYSRQGKILGRSRGKSSNQKFVVIVPGIQTKK
jgi:hypothetical protein